MNPKLLRRLLLVALLLPCVYLAGAGAAFLLRSHARTELGSRPPAEPMPPPTAASRILVVAAHPDDELLGCAGLIRAAVAAGADVRVVYLTTGDGFRMAVERQFRQVRVTGEDFRRFAEVRRAEAHAGLGVLGLPPEKALFLGYPDKGLMPLWNRSWSGHPYLSPFTRAARCPYSWALRPGAAYTAPDVLRDLGDAMAEMRPTAVFVHHPSDDHPDHCAAAAFVELALRRAAERGAAWARGCRLHHYLVHRGDWPVPQGLFRHDHLAAPVEMADLDTRWQSLELPAGDVDLKVRAIDCNASQTAMMRRFLVSFARRNEVFGELADAPLADAPARGIAADGDPADWGRLQPVALDPVNDSLIRNFQRGGDIRAVYACLGDGGAGLHVRIETYRRIPAQVQFVLRLRALGLGGADGGATTVVVRRGGVVRPRNASVAVGARDNHLEIDVPLRAIAARGSIAMSVETRLAGIEIDRTGFRFLQRTAVDPTGTGAVEAGAEPAAAQ